MAALAPSIWESLRVGDELIDSLLAALEARPGDTTLRLHVARQLLEAGRSAEAVQHAAQVLVSRPEDAGARAVLLAASQPSFRPLDSSPAVEAAGDGHPANVDLDGWYDLPAQLGPASAVPPAGSSSPTSVDSTRSRSDSR